MTNKRAWLLDQSQHGKLKYLREQGMTFTGPKILTWLALRRELKPFGMVRPP